MSGYLLKEFIAQSPVVEETVAMINAGCTLTANGRVYTSATGEELRDVLQHPHITFLRREDALSKYGSWAGGMFIHEPARIGFTCSEQKLLLSALRAGTDFELAEDLEISVSAVKKTWQSIYSKAERLGVGIKSGDSAHEGTERGKERKRGLLMYVRQHPEELRPVDLKLLKEKRNTAQRTRIRR